MVSSKGLTPAFQINPNLAPFNDDIQVVKDSVWSAMYADLFMMISQLDRRQITATEIDERREEKLIALGPVLERLHYEKLRPLENGWRAARLRYWRFRQVSRARRWA